MSLKQKIKWKTVKNYQTFKPVTNFIFLCVCIKCLILAKKTYESNVMEVIVDGIDTL